MAIPYVAGPLAGQITPQILQAMQSRNIAQKIAQLKLAALPAQQQAELARSAASTGLTQAQTGAIPGEESLRQAEIQKYLAQAHSPLAGQSLRGGPAEAASLKILKDKFGEDSEVYKNALAAFHANLNSEISRGRYYAANVKYKYLTPAQKLLKALHENATVEKGGMGSLPFQAPNNQGAQNQPPIGGMGTLPLQAANSQAVQNQTPKSFHDSQVLNAALQKRVSDTSTRERAIASGELLDTLNKVNFTPIAKYTGLRGRALLKSEEAAVTAGAKPSADYLSYKTFVNGPAKIIGDTVRWALKTSVRMPYVMHMLMPLADPTMKIWGNDPQLAIKRFNFFIDWAKRYHNVYQHASNYGVTSYGIREKRVPQTAEATQRQPEAPLTAGNMISSQLNEGKIKFADLTPLQKTTLRTYLMKMRGS